MKKRVIIGEMEKLNHKGVLDDINLSQIKKYYEHEKSGRSFSAYLTIIGLIMVSMGIILLFAYNWGLLTREMKVGLILLVLTTSQGVFGIAIWKEKKWITGAGVFVLAMCGLSIMMISQMYNISGSDKTYFLTWSLLSLPILYLGRSSLIGLLYSGLTLRYLMSDGNILIYLLLSLGLVLVKDSLEKYGNLSKKLSLIVFLYGIMFWYEGLQGRSPYSLMFYGGMISLLYIWPLGLKKLAGLVILVLAYVLTYKNAYYLRGVLEFNMKSILGILVYIGALVSISYKKEWKNPMNLHILLIPVAIFFSFGYVFYNVYLFALGLYYAFKGVKFNEINLFNKGSILMALILSTRFLDSGVSTLFRGVIFILIGLSLIGGNLYLSRRKS